MGNTEMAPNVFISEEGEMIFVNGYKLTGRQLDMLLMFERIVERFEVKYGNDIFKAAEKNAKQSEIDEYVRARIGLMRYGRY